MNDLRINWYQVYVTGVAGPVYHYKSSTWLLKRLAELADQHSLESCIVKVDTNYGTELVRVTFQRDYVGGWEWTTTDGIPTRGGTDYTYRSRRYTGYKHHSILEKE